MEIHRAARTMPVAEWVEMWASHADGANISLALPRFPSEEIQKITNNASGASTMRAAGTFYTPLLQEMQAIPKDATDLKVLDYGAGWGRITRVILRSFPPSNISAVDVDDRLVEAGGATLPGVDFRKIESGKKLPFDDNAFDVIFANSVFSHLSQELHLSTLVEISRILRPGGVFIGTTLGPRHYDSWISKPGTKEWITKVLGEEPIVREKLNTGEFVFGASRRWYDYGIAILPDGWSKQHWPESHLEVIRMRDDYSQTLNIAAKTA